MRRPWIMLAVLALPALALAHKPSDSYLTLQVDDEGTRGHWDIAVRDLDRALTLDSDGDGEITGSELRACTPALLDHVLARLRVARGGRACPLEAGQLEVVAHSDGSYARIPLRGTCVGAGPLSLTYDFFFELDPQHRAVVQGGDATFVLSAAQRSHALTVTSAPGVLALVGDGVQHILSGLDHVLFLLALLLPRRGASVRAHGLDVLRVITAFTVAHSLTLALAALGLVSMSSAIVEPAIAASVAIAALDNLWPVFGGSRASIAFALGLLHGFGFSSALSDLGLQSGALLRGLVSFNVGVELGQLAIVAVALPLLYLLRSARGYELVVRRGGSLAIAACALVWFAQRVTGG